MSISSINQTNLNSLQNLPDTKAIKPDIDKIANQQPSPAITFAADGRPLELVYQTAMDKLNEILLPDLGENAIQNAYDNGLDVSPEATADRIISGATGLLNRYLSANEGKDLEENFSNFMDIIRSGVEQGFSEARDILDGLQVLEGSILENVDRTYGLVQEGLDKYEQEFRNTQNLESVEPSNDKTAN